MSNQLFNEIGLHLPSRSGTMQPTGATVMSLKDSTSTAHVKGEVVLLSQDTHVSDTDFSGGAIDYTEFEDCPAGAATAIGATSQSRIFGVCLEDIAADGTGLIMVRGSCLALCEDAGANINNTTAAALIAMSGVGTIPGNLVSAQDAGAGVYFKVIALYRGASAISVPGVVLRPVVFDGVGGFFTGEMP